MTSGRQKMGFKEIHRFSKEGFEIRTLENESGLRLDLMDSDIDLFQDEQRVTSNVLSANIQANPVIIRTVLSKLKEAGIIDAALDDKLRDVQDAMEEELRKITMADVLSDLKKEIRRETDADIHDITHGA